MKRVITMLLVFASLLACLAACADTGEQQGSEQNFEQTEETRLDAVPDSLKYNGEDIVIISRAYVGWTWDEVAVPELNSEPVNDAIFNRNVAVNDRLNVNIVSSPIEDANPGLPLQEVRRAVLAGSEDYDLLAGAAYQVLLESLEGTFRDLSHLEYLDLEQEYWTQDFNEATTYADRQYSATGMIALSTYRFAFVTMFNKNIFDEHGTAYLYDAVNDGSWTLDYQIALSKEMYYDANGNGSQDEGDTFGLITSSHIGVDPYWASCNIPILTKNSDGDYEYVLNSGKLSDLTDKLLQLYYESGTLAYPNKANDGEQDDIRIGFAKGNAAMITTRLVAAEQADIRNMTDLYGIVPMPKYDKAQAEYGTMQHDQITVYSIPATVKDNKIEMVGAVMEVMASESLRTVKPAYYEIALKRKYMSDPIAWEMLDLIFNTIKIDAGIIYTNAFDGLHNNLRTFVTNKKNTVSSTFARMDKSMKKKIAKMQQKLDELE